MIQYFNTIWVGGCAIGMLINVLFWMGIIKLFNPDTQKNDVSGFCAAAGIILGTIFWVAMWMAPFHNWYNS